MPGFIKKTLFFTLLFLSYTFTYSDVTSDNWVKNNESFYLKTLSKELNNSDFYSLQQRARSLGLPEKQSADIYRQEIAKFYGITLIPSDTFNGDKIILERAGELKMIKLKEVDEENLHIIGGVKIIINAKDENKVSIKKEIEADEVYIDLKNKEITGSGNVIYKDEKLEFNGEHFYYNYNINRGTLLSGKTKIKQKDKSGLEGAFFTGERIAYVGSEESILYDGKLTTCDAEEPHYYIQVKRLWLNKESEWGLLNGIVYVGPMPFLYFPVYYHPKNIDIYPSFGYKTREGWFVNTTFSILGKMDIGDSASTTQISDYGLQERRKKPASLFSITKNDIDTALNTYYDSKEFYKKNPKLRFLTRDFNSLSMSFKIFADAYTNLGFYYGGFFYFNIDHKRFPVEIFLLTDYAFSRRIWKDDKTDQYTFYNPNDRSMLWTSDFDKNLQNTYYFYSANPFELRTSQFFRIDGELFKDVVKLKYSGQIEYASDARFYKDFYSRNLTFSYIDLLADALKYSIEKNDKGGSIFTLADEKEVSSVPTINDFIELSLSPITIPDLFGLNLISSVSINAKVNAGFQTEQILKYAPGNIQQAEDHKYERYFLEKILLPETTVKMNGELLNYDVFINMNKKYNESLLQKQQSKNTTAKKTSVMYTEINRIGTLDASTDKTVIDYKYLLPFFSLSIPSDNKSSKTIDTYYNEIIISDNSSDYKQETIKDIKKEIKNYDEIIAIDKEGNQNLFDIKMISFSLNYDITDINKNNLFFNTKFKRDNEDIDNMMEIVTGQYDINKRLRQFNIENDLTATLNGSLGLFKLFSDSSELIKLSPNLKFTFKKNYDDMDVYEKYLDTVTTIDATADRIKKINTDKNNLLYSNRMKTEYKLVFSDTLKNDFSFGTYLLSGTNLSTAFNANLYEYNEQKSYNFNILNEVNTKKNTPGYQPVDSGNYYFQRDFYHMISELSSKLNLSFNVLPKGFEHTLNITTGPKINFIVPQASMNILKDELWLEESGSVKYLWTDVMGDMSADKQEDVGRITEQAREYVYYRKTGKNLNDKVSEFFFYENFWEGAKNFRKIFESFSIDLKYSYILNNINYFSINNIISFNLVNIGYFSNGRGSTAGLAVYPDNSLTMSVFNSMFQYTNNLTFTKESDKTKDKQRLLDENMIVKFADINTFTFRLDGNKFEFKLPKGNWFSLTSRTDLRYDLNKKWYGPTKDVNRYNIYLNSQDFTFSGIMDIFSVTLNYKSYDFKDAGLNVVLDGGMIKLGYSFNEIPQLFNLINFSFRPDITYNFSSKKDPYYNESGVLDQISQSYYDSNKLLTSLSMELIIGKDKEYQTTFKFSTSSSNTKLSRYYEADSEVTFFDDLIKSFNFAKEEDRVKSAFNLQSISFSIEHKLHDWILYFDYSGKPERNYTGNKYVWDNTFSFKISWNIDSKNQLMKLFNKSKVDDKYEKGSWRQRSMSLDFDE